MANKDTSRTEKSQANVKKNKNNGKKNKKKNQPKYKKILKGTFLGILVALLLCFVVGLGYVFAIIKSTPELDVNAVLSLNEPSMLFDSEGTYIDNLPTNEERYKITLDEMSEYIKDAYIAIEDERFYSHPGIDIKRTLGSALRSGLYYFTGKGSVQGGSTLTQQLIKNTLLTNDVKIERKIREIYLSLSLEKKLTKDQILEAYLNTIPLGGKVYGVEAAAKYYFEKSAKDLTLPESAFIAGLTQAPTSYSPYNEANKEDPTIYLDRTKTVLMKMKDLGKITQEEYDEAYAFVDANQFAFSQTVISYKINYEWFVYPAVDQVREDLKEIYKYNDEEVDRLFSTGGLKIYTTMDRAMQDSTQAVLDDRNSIKQLDIYANPEVTDENGTLLLQAAAAIMDYRTGEVKVLVGGRGDQPARSTNRAYDALRSIGSTTKPLTVYGPAIDTKVVTAGTVFDDALLPSSISAKYNNYNPQNWNFKSDGYITVRESLALSKNVTTVMVEDKLGIENGLSYGEKLGIIYGEKSRSSIATLSLGEFTGYDEEDGSIDGGNPFILASAFGTFGNNGLYTEPILYTKVVDGNGKVLLEKTPKQEQVFSPQTAYIMRDLLKGPLSFDGYLARLSNMPVIGKTGTTSRVTDFLFAGLTPYYSGAVWIGYDNQAPMGGSYSSSAASLWGAIMAPIHENLEYKEFDGNPGGVTTVAICKDSGKRATDLCTHDQRGSRVYTEMFISGTEPSGVCDVHVSAKVNKNNNKLATEDTPKDLVEEKVFIKKENASSSAADYKYVLPTEKDDTKAEKNEEFKLSDLGIKVGSNVDNAINILKSKGVNITIINNESKNRTIKSISSDKAKKGDTIVIEVESETPNSNGNPNENENTEVPNQ
ncbi:MAG: transglycosylase domain-containing protein [Clostridium sp.]|jgi:penicillin-binding protein|uniref:transglycosylase domain-containing protein n=1 Tax=Clostridium sp. TaxID=1506 RepID=UPI0025D2198E|nr:transglycosylase domain-containing protein [Clostridium sp.]MDY6227797.1 transglycosylase domain-containing protein [Clostridium sp.]